MDDICPNPRIIQAIAVPGKPPPNVIVADANTVGIQLIEVKQQGHEWDTGFQRWDAYSAPKQLIRVCKWCNKMVTVEVP